MYVKDIKQKMPKRKREEEEEDKWAATLYERWDADMILSINELVLVPEVEGVVSEIAAEMTMSLQNPAPSARRMVSYTAREFKEGRVYGKGLQGVGGWIRRLCSFKCYHDLDIVNCGPTLLYQILKRHTECPPMVKGYALDRSGMFKRLRDQEPELKATPDKALKSIFLKCLHGGKHTNHFHSIGLLPDHQPIPLLLEWEDTVRKAMKKLMKHSEYKKMAKQIKNMKDKKNKVGTFTSWVWQKEENQIILALADYLREKEGFIQACSCLMGSWWNDRSLTQPSCPRPCFADLKPVSRQSWVL